jgi:hypothetical protein
MPRIRDLFELVSKFWVLANGTVNPDEQWAMQKLCDKYRREAEDVRHDQIVQAAFPKASAKTGLSKKS